MVSSRPNSRPVSNFFRCSNDFIMQKCVSRAACLHWLNNVSGVYLVHVYLLFIGQQCLGYFFRYRPFCFPLDGGLCKFTPTLEENDQSSAYHS
jgi:hypothetical protein